MPFDVIAKLAWSIKLGNLIFIAIGPVAHTHAGATVLFSESQNIPDLYPNTSDTSDCVFIELKINFVCAFSTYFIDSGSPFNYVYTQQSL